MLRQMRELIYFECLLRVRHAQDWLYPFAFFALMMLLFPLVFSPDPQIQQRYAASFIWLAMMFSMVLANQNLFHSEYEEDFIEQMLLSPIPLSYLLFIKLFTHWCFSTLPLILLVPFAAFSFHLSLPTTLTLTLSLVAGTPLIHFLGSLNLALTYGLKEPGILLGLMTFPLSIPILILGVASANATTAGLSSNGVLCLLVGLSLLGITLLPWVIGQTFQICLDS